MSCGKSPDGLLEQAKLFQRADDGKAAGILGGYFQMPPVGWDA